MWDYLFVRGVLVGCDLGERLMPAVLFGVERADFDAAVGLEHPAALLAVRNVGQRFVLLAERAFGGGLLHKLLLSNLILYHAPHHPIAD
jgi:hypothetical protein